MTCIVGIVEDGTVYIGGDSQTNAGSRILRAVRDKVNKRGNFVMGAAGPTRIAQLIMYSMDLSKIISLLKNQDEYIYD